jgi:hypothetical protein
LLIDAASGKVDWTTYADQSAQELKTLIEAKLAGQSAEAPAPPPQRPEDAGEKMRLPQDDQKKPSDDGDHYPRHGVVFFVCIPSIGRLFLIAHSRPLFRPD